jgi:hypothetical protein
MKSLFSFSTAKLRKIRGKNWGRQDWLFGGLISQTRYFFESRVFSLVVQFYQVGFSMEFLDKN